MIIFLISINSHIKGSLPVCSISNILNDFIEQYQQESKILKDKDYQEIERIRQNPFLLSQSHLFRKVEPFLLPFYERKRGFLNNRY